MHVQLFHNYETFDAYLDGPEFVEAEHGIHGMDAIAHLCARELAAIRQDC